jgi:hypothetical protein
MWQLGSERIVGHTEIGALQASEFAMIHPEWQNSRHF